MRQPPTEMTGESIQPVFWAGMRTPFAVAQRGSFKDIRPDELLVMLIKEHRKKFLAAYQNDGGPQDLVVGCAYPEGEQGYNIAQTAGLGAGLEVSGMTVNRLCGSALEAAAIAAAGVACGRTDAWLVAGVESMSRVPRRGANFSESELVKVAAPQAYVTMGETAENVARRFPRISRAAQEEFTAASHTASHWAWDTGFYDDHVLPIGGLRRDEGIRFPVNLEKMASLPPAFQADGLITAATSSPMSDGAAAGLVTSERFARASGARSFLRIIDTVTSHVAPEFMGMGPVHAVQKLFARNKITVDSIAAVEMNEAFAIQSMACIDELKFPPNIMNTMGGALALGHPLGASGLRLLMSLHERLKRLTAETSATNLGIATLCIGGGQGIAMLCEFATAEESHGKGI